MYCIRRSLFAYPLFLSRYTVDHCRFVGGWFVVECIQYIGLIFICAMIFQMVPADIDSTKTEVNRSVGATPLLMHFMSATPGGRKLSNTFLSVLLFRFHCALSSYKPLRLAAERTANTSVFTLIVTTDVLLLLPCHM